MERPDSQSHPASSLLEAPWNQRRCRSRAHGGAGRGWAGLAAFALAFMFAGWFAPADAVEEDSSAAGQVIVDRIRTAARALEREHVGSFSKREIRVEIQDPESGEVESTIEVEADVWDYYGENARRVVRACKIDGEAVDFSKCEEKQQLEPAYRIFGEDADEHYRLEYGGRAEWKGQPSHRIRVVPVEETTRHLKGDLYFRAEDFRPVGMAMTLADYPFGLESLSIEVDLAQRDGRAVIETGRTDVHIRVPLLVDQRRVSTFRASDQRLLKEREGP